MPAGETLVRRVRAVLAPAGAVEEKTMFGGLAFMVDGKMCVTVGKDRIMCRIDPDEHDAAIARPGCETMVMRGRPLRGYVRVNAQALREPGVLEQMVGMAIRYNPRVSRRRA